MSSPTVGSSRNSMRGMCSRPPAMSSLLRMPPEYVSTASSCFSPISIIPMTSSIREAALPRGMRFIRAWSMRFSRPVRNSSDDDSCWTYPMDRRTPPGSSATSMPDTRALPDVGLSRVVRIIIVVLLPAPLGPRNPNISPSSTSNVMPSTARTPPPNSLTRDSVRIECTAARRPLIIKS